MAKYPIDTFRCTALPLIQKTLHGYRVAEHSGATSFFISCNKRLWDAVGHFLGCRAPTDEALPAGLFDNAEGVRRVGNDPTFCILA
jgi:hypothetical protein